MEDLRQLFLFGRPRFDENGLAYELTYRKGLALFAYLGLTAQRHSRDALATLLWPDYSQTRARANLRRTLYAINRAGLGNWIDIYPDSIALASTPPVQVDIDQFQTLIDRWKNHEHPDPLTCNACVDILRQAIDFYPADFLADFYLPDSNSFEEWAGLQRERMRRLYFLALDNLATLYLAGGDYAAAQIVAYRQIESDDLRESSYRQLMNALALSGQRSVALQVYADLKKLLEEELDVEPERATMALVEQIRTGKLEPEIENRLLPSAPDPAPVKSRTTSRAPRRLSHSPYRGLYAFREEDAPLFFGREEFTEQLLIATNDQSLVAVVGPSGSGKSSVVYAGLVAQLRTRSDIAIASFRPTSDPLRALAGTLVPWQQPHLDDREQLVEVRRLVQAFTSNETTLIETVEQIGAERADRRLLLLADQFEELFTRCSDLAARHRFLDILLEAVFDQQYRSEPLFTLVLTMRADFLGQALAYRPLADALRDADVKLGPMTNSELDQAIKRPASAHGVSFESGLVSRIREDVAGEPGNLPLLEFALEMLWHEQKAGLLTHEAYEAIGRVDGALTRYANEVYQNLIPEEQVAARRIFIQLVRPGDSTEDTRRVATRAELGEADWTIVQDLADARLLITDSDTAASETAEVVHEALINGWDRLRDWMFTDREFRLWQERLRAALRQWQTSDGDEGALLHGVSLSLAIRWLNERPAGLGQAEIDYIHASLDFRNRQQLAAESDQRSRERFRRRLTYAAVAGLTIMAVLALLAVLQWRQADAQRQLAQTAEQEALTRLAGQLSANAQTLPDDQLDAALLLSVEAVRLADNNTTQTALKAILQRNPALIRYGTVPFDPFAVTVKNTSPQWGNHLYIHSAGSEEITVWQPDWQSATLVQDRSIPFKFEAFPSEGKTLHTLANSQDDALLAMAFCSNPVGEPCQEPRIALWRTDQALFETVDLHEGEFKLTAIALSPDGSWLAQGNLDGSILLWDTTLGRSLGEPLVGHSNAIRLLTFSPDGRWLASWSRDGLVALWDISLLSSDPVAQFGGHGVAASLNFSPDGNLLLSAGQSDDRLLIWEVDQAIAGFGNPAWRLDGPQGGSFLAEFSPDGRYLLAGGNNGQIYRWSTAILDQSGPAPEPTILRGHRNFVSAFFYDQNGTMLSLAPDATILWDLIGSALPRRTLEGHEQHVVSLAFSQDGNTLFSVACDIVGSGGPCMSAEFLAWDTASAAVQSPSKLGPLVETWAARLSSDGDLAFIGSPEQALVLANPILAGEPGQAPQSLPAPLTGSFAFSPNGKILATGNCQEADFSIPQCLRSTVTLWDWPAGTYRAQEITAHEGLIQDMAFSPDGRSFATAGEDGILRLWKLTGSKLTSQQVNSAAEEVHDALAFSPDGTMLAGAGCGQDEANGSCLGGAAWLWDLAGGEPVREPIGEPLLNDETAFFFLLTFSPDGRYLVTVDGSGAIIFWQMTNGERIIQLPAHTGPVVALRFSPDGRYLATGGIDRLINLFNVDALLAQAGQSSADGIEQACQRASRNLTLEEYSSFFGNTPYRTTCPE